MKILALDTSTEACSAALYIDGEILIKYQIAPREHSRLILQMIDDLLKQADLTIKQVDAIAFGRGPGSFMGLRIAAGVVQGIAFAHDIPVIPISTLKAIAQRAYEQSECTHILATLDARMDEVYWGAYMLTDTALLTWEVSGEELVISPDKINLSQTTLEKDVSWLAAGQGWGAYKDRLLADSDFMPAMFVDDCLPSAEQIAILSVAQYKLGNTVSAADAIPVYLRNDVAKKSKPVVF